MEQAHYNWSDWYVKMLCGGTIQFKEASENCRGYRFDKCYVRYDVSDYLLFNVIRPTTFAMRGEIIITDDITERIEKDLGLSHNDLAGA